MTRQTLVLESSTRAAAPVVHQTPAIAARRADGTTANSTPASARPMPYSKAQQLELLHLQAEAEALLQQVQVLTQQQRSPAAAAPVEPASVVEV